MTTANAEHYLGDLEAATRLVPSTKPYIMMNLLKFKTKAQYATGYEGPKVDAETGRQMYIKYKDMFTARATELGLELSIVFLGEAHTQIAIPQEGESWDTVIMARYESWAAFKSILQDEKYDKEIQPHRVAALQDFRSFAVTEKMDI